jgi:hypothetical protein
VRDPARRRARAENGIGWAIFVRGQVDVRRPWPPFVGCQPLRALL